MVKYEQLMLAYMNKQTYPYSLLHKNNIITLLSLLGSGLYQCPTIQSVDAATDQYSQSFHTGIV